jgi:hypothetical protein
VVAHRCDLEAVFLDVTVARVRMSQPRRAAGDLGDPHVILDRWVGDWAGRPSTFVDHRPRVPWIGDVGTQVGQHVPEAEEVGVDVASVRVMVVGFGLGCKSSGVPSRISEEACTDQP